MENLNYFIATLNVERIMEDGTSKKVSEDYLIDAMSFTEAEEKAVGEMEGCGGEFEVTRIVRPRLAGVMTSDSDRFFRVKITETTFDDNTMCEKKTTKAYIVQSLGPGEGRPGRHQLDGARRKRLGVQLGDGDGHRGLHTAR